MIFQAELKQNKVSFISEVISDGVDSSALQLRDTWSDFVTANKNCAVCFCLSLFRKIIDTLNLLQVIINAAFHLETQQSSGIYCFSHLCFGRINSLTFLLTSLHIISSSSDQKNIKKYSLFTNDIKYMIVVFKQISLSWFFNSLFHQMCWFHYFIVVLLTLLVIIALADWSQNNWTSW